MESQSHGHDGHGPRTAHAYATLRKRILGGELPVGAVLAEARIAEDLGLSRTPVRQALRLLLQEGLVEVGPRRQAMVRGLSGERREEILALREALERIAIERACQVMGLDDVDHLRLLLIRQERAANAQDQARFLDLDEEFHLAIALGAHLPILHKFLSQLRGFVQLMRAGTIRYPGHLAEVVAEHAAIVDALEEHDGERALAALSHHLHKTEYAFADELSASPAPVGGPHISEARH